MTTKLRPLYDRVLVKRLDGKEKTEGGLFIPDSAKEKPMEGEIIAVGNGRLLENGTHRPVSVKVGNRVLFAKYAETEVKLNNESYLLLKEDDLLGVLE